MVVVAAAVVVAVVKMMMMMIMTTRHRQLPTLPRRSTRRERERETGHDARKRRRFRPAAYVGPSLRARIAMGAMGPVIMGHGPDWTGRHDPAESFFNHLRREKSNRWRGEQVKHPITAVHQYLAPMTSQVPPAFSRG